MSQIHRVIILNKPLKIRGKTPFQWVLLVGSAALGFFIASKVPKEWQFNHIPAGFFVFGTVFGLALIFVTASEMKPLQWWRNVILYGCKLMPLMFFPHSEPAREYIDENMIESKKEKVLVEFEQ
jgi:hypothetical protein